MNEVQLTQYLTAGWPVWRIAAKFEMTVPEVRAAIGAAVARGAVEGKIFGAKS